MSKCVWTVKSEDVVNMEFWSSTSCKPHNFVTKLDPIELSYCPYCGEPLKVKEDANT